MTANTGRCEPNEKSMFESGLSPARRRLLSQVDSHSYRNARPPRQDRPRWTATMAAHAGWRSDPASSEGTFANTNITGGSNPTATRPAEPPLAGRARRTPAVPRASLPVVRSGVGVVFAFFVLLLLPAPILAQSIVYVDNDATGANDGSSWTDAFTDLQSALDRADAGAAHAKPNSFGMPLLCIIGLVVRIGPGNRPCVSRALLLQAADSALLSMILVGPHVDGVHNAIIPIVIDFTYDTNVGSCIDARRIC